MTGDAERTAIGRLQSGDIGGLELLVKSHQLFAQRVAFGVLGDRELAQDASQTAFITVFNRIQTFDLAREFRPWLGGIVVREARRLAREQGIVAPQPGLDDWDALAFGQLLGNELPHAEDGLERAELRALVGDALAKLSPSQRAAVIEHYYVEQPAEASEAKAATKRSQLRHARARLRRWLMESGIPAAHS